MPPTAPPLRRRDYWFGEGALLPVSVLPAPHLPASVAAAVGAPAAPAFPPSRHRLPRRACWDIARGGRRPRPPTADAAIAAAATAAAGAVVSAVAVAVGVAAAFTLPPSRPGVTTQAAATPPVQWRTAARGTANVGLRVDLRVSRSETYAMAELN